MRLSVRRAQTRDRVISAAIEVFSERGVQAASVEEICERAGFTRGAFYSNFDSKIDVCVAILELQIEQARQAAIQAISSFDAGKTDLESLINGAVAVFVEVAGLEMSQVLVLSEMRLWAAREPELRVVFRKLRETHDALFAELIEQRVASHGCRLVLPVSEVLAVLRSVHDDNVIDQARDTNTVDQHKTAHVMAAVLRGLIVPIS